MALQYLFSYGSSVISLAFVGHLGTYEMSSAVLGTSFSNVTGFALLTGLSSALETLCGQVRGLTVNCAHTCTVACVLAASAILLCSPLPVFGVSCSPPAMCRRHMALASTPRSASACSGAC